MVHLSYWIVPCTTYSMCCCGVLCTGSGSVSVKCRYSFEHAHPPYHFPWATSSHICIIFNRCHRKSWVSIHCHYFLGGRGSWAGHVLRVWYSMYFGSVVAAFFRCHTHCTSIFPISYWERSPIRTNANVNVPRNNIIDLEIGCMCVYVWKWVGGNVNEARLAPVSGDGMSCVFHRWYKITLWFECESECGKKRQSTRM